MAYGDFKDMSRWTDSDKVLRDKAILLKIKNMMDINVDLFHWFIKFLIEKLVVLILLLSTNKV